MSIRRRRHPPIVRARRTELVRHARHAAAVCAVPARLLHLAVVVHSLSLWSRHPSTALSSARAACPSAVAVAPLPTPWPPARHAWPSACRGSGPPPPLWGHARRDRLLCLPIPPFSLRPSWIWLSTCTTCPPWCLSCPSAFFPAVRLCFARSSIC